MDYVSDEEMEGYRRKDESTQRKLKEFKRMIQKRRKHMGGSDNTGADFENDDDQIENHILSGKETSVTCRGEASKLEEIMHDDIPRLIIQDRVGCPIVSHDHLPVDHYPVSHVLRG